MSKHLKLFSGNSTIELSSLIANKLKTPIGKLNSSLFSDGEINIEITENVRGSAAYIIQSTSSPCNDNLMELVLTADALRRASATKITAVVPYLGYARQDRRVRSARVPISAKVVADILASVGICRLLTVDLHADQIQGFFHIPVDNVYASSIFIEDINSKNYEDIAIVSPDIGGVVRARALAKKLDVDLAIIDKRRLAPNEAQVMNVIGDVKNRTCILVDDIIDTAGTICGAAKALKQQGAKQVIAYCTHPVLSGPAIDRISKSELNELIVTDTIKLSENAKSCNKIRQISLSTMLAEAIQRIDTEESLKSMFS